MKQEQQQSIGARIWGMKCPRCGHGDLFETSTFSFQKSFEMPDKCPECGQTYMPEPGFYYGAMFISYIFTGWLMLIILGLFILIFKWSIGASFAVLFTITAILFVWFFRISRSIWINIRVKHSPKWYASILEKKSVSD